MTDKEMISQLTRQLEVSTLFLQLDANKLREGGNDGAAVPTEGQIASNLALINQSRSFHYAEAVSDPR